MICRRLLLRHRALAKFSTSSASKPSLTSHSQSPPSSIISPSFSQPLPKRNIPSFLLLTAGTLLSSCAVYTATEDERISAGFRQNAERAKDSFKRVTGSMKQTGAAAAVLWKSLASVLSSANHEVKRGFEIRVAALVADIVAANEGRRRAIVEAGNGAVVDWLLDTVGKKSAVEGVATQAEAARALAFLIGDVDVREKVLGRPGAVPSLLRFIFSFQPKKALKHKHVPLDGIDISKGRSMLVAAIMDVVTSNCDDVEKASFHPSLPPNANIRDIAAAIEVIEEGGMHFDEEHENDKDDEDGDIGMKGIGIKVIGGTTILGFSKAENLLRIKDSKDDCLIETHENNRSDISWQKRYTGSSKMHHFTSFSAPGLWDDLQREHVAVPFAAWALANWALASGINRSHIHELDSDGHAILTALTASERTVKWHGSMVARVLLEDQHLPLTNCVPDWCFSLLSTVSQSSKNDDMSLAWAALSAFIASVKRCDDAKITVVEKGLHLMRETAKATEKHINMQEALARALELLYTSDMHLPLDESQKWAGILLRWIFNQFSTNSTRSSAITIISYILEDHGPASIPLSQGWLTILLTEMLKSRKMKGALEKTDEVQNQIHQSNALIATQSANLLATAVVNLARNQVLYELDSVATSPLVDFLSLEPFSAINKNVSKDKLRKFDAADSVISTLKGIKALSDLCIEDSSCQDKIVDLGVLFLLRRLLLADDYEKLAANETYDASRVLDPQEKKSTSNGSANETNDSSSVRIPPTVHIRRHAARLLMILSSLPKVAKVIVADQTLCAWLEECSSGTIPCSNDLKVRSYAKATLLNAYCIDRMGRNVRGTGRQNQNNECPRYGDMLFLINPELQHWKCCKTGKDSADGSKPNDENDSMSPHSNVHTIADVSSSDSTTSADNIQMSRNPPIDVVFVHGLCGGAFKSWRMADDKSSTTSKAGLIENIDQEAGKKGTCWPREWLATDFPEARLFTVKYKTNLSQWTGASLPLQEVSSMMLQKLIDAGIGDHPVVFVTHSMGGLVVKQMLYQAKLQNVDKFVSNTVGIVFYSCPHFGSKLADMPMRMGLVLRPAPSIRELRSGSPRLMELNEFLRKRYNNGVLKILSFSETQVTPIVEGYGGWAFRMEIVPIESAYPGFGDIIVLDATDHINSCKPVNRTDPSYAKTLEFLQKLRANMT